MSKGIFSLRFFVMKASERGLDFMIVVIVWRMAVFRGLEDRLRRQLFVRILRMESVCVGGINDIG